RWKFDFDFREIIKKDARTLDTKDVTTPKATAALPTKAESSYAGQGPEFKHLLFRLSGRSPLVAHFLNVKKIGGRSLSTTGPKMQRTEISKNPPLAPTYQDIIKETQKFSKVRHQQKIDFYEQTQREIEKLRWDRIQFNKKIDRLKKEFSNCAEQESELMPSKLNITTEFDEKPQIEAETEAETEKEVEAEMEKEVEAEMEKEVEAEMEKEVEAEMEKEMEADLGAEKKSAETEGKKEQHVISGSAY
ncbi:hypothetical protein scyTo_0020515, partial [Scyliorhinus torazame]|nr:hypothetical protein [Scyliorhinus torazame]